jgi:hypothetical protein
MVDDPDKFRARKLLIDWHAADIAIHAAPRAVSSCIVGETSGLGQMQSCIWSERMNQKRQKRNRAPP